MFDKTDDRVKKIGRVASKIQGLNSAVAVSDWTEKVLIVLGGGRCEDMSRGVAMSTIECTDTQDSPDLTDEIPGLHAGLIKPCYSPAGRAVMGVVLMRGSVGVRNPLPGGAHQHVGKVWGRAQQACQASSIVLFFLLMRGPSLRDDCTCVRCAGQLNIFKCIFARIVCGDRPSACFETSGSV